MHSRSGTAKRDELPAFIMVGAFFLCGCALGGYVSGHLSGTGLDAATAFVGALTAGDMHLTFAERLFNSFVTIYKLPLLVFLLGMTSYGLIALPAVFAARGFLLTFFLGCFSSLLGTSGLLAGLAIILPSCIFALPCMLLLSISAYVNAGGRKTGYGINGSAYAKDAVKYLVYLLPGVLADMFLGPVLLRAFSAGLG